MNTREVASIVKEAGVKFVDDNASRMGAAIAFYAILSLSPLLLVVVGLAGMVFGQQAANGEALKQMEELVGREGAVVLQQLVAESPGITGTSLAAIAGFAVLFFASTGVFVEMRGALNTIWSVPEKKKISGIMAMFWERVMAMLLVCGLIALLGLSVVVSAVLSGISDEMAGWMPGMNLIAELANFVVTLGLLTLLFAMILQWLPETELAWSDMWFGAAVTAVLFSIGKYLIGLYLGTAAVGSAYGTAGAFVVLLVWIYYSSQILLFGAELTFVYSQRTALPESKRSDKVALPQRH